MGFHPLLNQSKKRGTLMPVFQGFVNGFLPGLNQP